MSLAHTTLFLDVTMDLPGGAFKACDGPSCLFFFGGGGEGKIVVYRFQFPDVV